jgi:hypothetical protein
MTSLDNGTRSTMLHTLFTSDGGRYTLIADDNVRGQWMTRTRGSMRVKIKGHPKTAAPASPSGTPSAGSGNVVRELQVVEVVEVQPADFDDTPNHHSMSTGHSMTGSLSAAPTSPYRTPAPASLGVLFVIITMCDGQQAASITPEVRRVTWECRECSC